MEDLQFIGKIFKKEIRKIKRKKYRTCIYCLKDITKTNYSRHLYSLHYSSLSNFKKKKVLAKLFIKDTNKIIEQLNELKDLLKIMSILKKENGNINNKKLKKKLWFINYDRNLSNLFELLKKKEKNNDDEEM